MKMHILSMHQGTFFDDEKKSVDYSNAWVLPKEHLRDSHEKGRKPQKVKVAWDLVRAVNHDDLPGDFEVEVELGAGGKMVLVSAKSAKSGSKAA